MQTFDDSNDAAVARAVMARTPGASDTAESELYRRFAPRVRLYGLRHLRDADAACDLAQQVLLLTIEKLRDGAVRDPEAIASFILGTSRRIAAGLKRRERRREMLQGRMIDVPAFAPPAADAALDLDRIEACLGQLAERERVVVLMTFYAERTAADTARELGITEGNVRVIRHRAVARLRECVMARSAG
jgi:RNA polymerase sigma-70 factor, ECF subfamily